MYYAATLAIADIEPQSAIVMLLIMAVVGKIFGPHGRIR
jgi:hypothetical protein